MIVLKKSDAPEESFLKLLEDTKANVLEELRSKNLKVDNGDAFESLVLKSTKKASEGTEFEEKIYQTARQEFPDIIAKQYFGIEVKMTTSNKWVSTGNSILESRRVKGVEKIFMFFGKFGGDIDIKYRSYQECLSGIGVTHSPRYKIDMNLALGDSIFDKMGIEYETLKSEDNPIKVIKKYYREQLKNGQELWWADTHVEERTVNPIIQPYVKLSKDDQQKFIAECFILFPEILGKGNTKYERAAAYLITRYNAVCANLRDNFSAQGQVDLSVNGVTLKKIPQVYKRLMNSAKIIRRAIESISEDDILYYWNKKSIDGDRESVWKQKINESSNFIHDKIKPSDIYEWGLKQKEK